MIKKYTTDARPAPKNEIWEQEIDNTIFICERPNYFFKKLEMEIFSRGLKKESKLLFNKILPQFSDKEGRWWSHEKFNSKYLVELFTKYPIKYIEIINKKVQTVKELIKTLKEIEPLLYTDDTKILRTNFERLFDTIVNYYSYYSTTYIT